MIRRVHVAIIASALIGGGIAVAVMSSRADDRDAATQKRIDALEFKLHQVCSAVETASAMGTSWKSQPPRAFVGEMIEIANRPAVRRCADSR